MKLTLYDSAQGGHALWTETRSVNVSGGIFNVDMGAVDPITLSFKSPYWLGVAIGNNPEFSPRTLLTASPYAHNSNHADTATVALSVVGGSGGSGVASLNGKSGAITLLGSGATTVTTYGDSIVIASSGSGGPTGVQTLQNGDATIAVTNKNGPITSVIVAPNGINTAQLANNAVTTAQLAANSVTTAQLAANSVTTTQLAANSVTSAQLAANSVTATQLASGSVTTGKISTTGATTGQAIVYNGAIIAWGNPAAGSLALPFSQSVSSGSAAFAVTNTGLGDAFSGTASGGNGFTGTSTNGDGLSGTSTSGYGVYGTSNSNNAAYFEITNGTSASSAVYGYTKGLSFAGQFEIDNVNNALPALAGTTNGTGFAVRGIINSTTNGSDAAFFSTKGVGNALLADYEGSGISGPGGNNIAVFQDLGTNKARIDNTGKGFFDGNTQMNGADIAESFLTDGNAKAYEPGDVLVVSTDEDRHVAKSAGAYSTLVAGVYATRPGVLLTDRTMDESLDGTVPVGVIGVLPTKVCTESGAIRRGDLLVTSSIPGCAMKMNMRAMKKAGLFPEYVVIGKALQDYNGKGVGKINVLVNVK
jgi:hypothetical protein